MVPFITIIKQEFSAGYKSVLTCNYMGMILQIGVNYMLSLCIVY